MATIPVTIVGLALSLGLAWQGQAPAQPRAKSQPKAKASGWTTFTSRDGTYRIEFPTRPQESTQVRPGGVGSLEVKTYLARAGGCAYLLQEFRYPRPFPGNAVEERLTRQKQSYLQGQSLLLRENNVTVGDVFGQHFEYQTPSPRANGMINHLARHFIRGSSYYLVSVTTLPNQPLPREADRFIESLTFLSPLPGRSGAMARGAGKGAGAEKPASPDGTPEEALRTFMVAAVAHDEAALRGITLPNPELDWLTRGEPAPEDVVARIRGLARKMKIRRLKPGDRIRGPEGEVVAVKPDDVGENRALLLPEGAPEPIRAQRFDGHWKIDARPAINQRKEAAAALEKGSKS